MRNRAYIDGVDQLIEQTPVEQVLTHFGQPLPEKSTGELRLPCVFSDDCDESSYGTLSVSLNDPAKVIYCHSCGVRGNLLTLIHGLAHHRPPAGGKLRGDEFKESVQTLQRIRGDVVRPQAVPVVSTPPPSAREVEPIAVNVPLKDQEKTRGLVNLWEDFIVDVEQMTPAAAAYFRKRPWLTPDACRHWKMGYLPRDGRSLFRGSIVYAHTDETGEILTYSARDPLFDEKWAAWIRDGRPEKCKPMKHRYVKGYHRGLELYGQSAERLQDRRLKESLGSLGLVVVEGMNEVMRLNLLGVTAVGLCSNKVTDEQVDKIERFARGAAFGRVVLMPDNDDEGEAGFKDLLWMLAERGLDVRLAWSRQSHDGRFDGQQPEDMTDHDWNNTLLPRLGRAV